MYVDTEVVTTAELSENDILALVQRGGGDTENDDTNEKKIDDSPIPSPPPNVREANKSLHILRQYFKSKDPVSGEESITLVTKLEKALADDIIHHASVQTQITDFYAV